MSTVLRTCDFEPENLTFGNPKTNAHGGTTMYANYAHEGKVLRTTYLQTPFMYNPFGINLKPMDESKPKYHLELSFGSQQSEYMQQFHQKMRRLDERFKETVREKAESFLGETEELDEEYFAEFHKPVVRPYTKKNPETNVREATGEFPDTIRFKIPYYLQEDGSVSWGPLRVFDATRIQEPDKGRVQFDTIEDLAKILGKGNKVRAIVQLRSGWRSDPQFGISWVVHRIQVVPGDQQLGDDPAFIDAANPEVAEDNSDEDFE